MLLPAVMDPVERSSMIQAPRERGCCNLGESYGFFGNLRMEFPDFCEIKSKLYNDMAIEIII